MGPAQLAQIDRRTLLRGGLGAVAGLTLAGIAGCAGEPTPAATSGTPRRGGTLRLVALGNPADGLDPLTATGTAAFVAFYQLYDQLVRIEGDRFFLALAESVEPDRTGQSWTIRLRSGARFHDGRPVTARDVAASLALLADPKRSPSYGPVFADVDPAASKVRDARTLVVGLRRPRGDFLDAVLSQASYVFPESVADGNRSQGIGSGPFRLRDARGGGYRLVRNDDHWDGAPLLDAVEITSVADPAARLNAVRGNQADYALGVPASAARSAAGARDVAIRRGGPANSIAMTVELNAQVAPTRNPDVRLALKLLTDRQALVDTVLFGQGRVGNDLLGLGLSGYADDIPQRRRDVDRARSLLARAGVSELTLRAADLVPGIVDGADVLAEQAREAGLRITVDRADPSSYFTDFKRLLSTPAQGFYFVNRPPAVSISTYTGSAGTYNVSGIAGADYDRRLVDAQSTVDDQARRQKFVELQQYLHEQGGDLVWGFAEQLDGVRPGLDGVRLSQSVPLLSKAYLPA